MSLTRLLLIISVTLGTYCVALGLLLLLIQVPWAWVPVTIGVVIGLCKKHRQLYAFGTARWAEFRDLWGMVDGGNGLIIGEVEDTTSRWEATKALFDFSIPARISVPRFYGAFQKVRPHKLVRLNKAPHSVVFAPTGAGKTSAFAAPFLLTCTDSCVVVDLKAGELAKLTADARRKMGHSIYFVDPFKLATQTPDTLNAMEFIDKSSPFAIDDCREIASAMVDRKDEKGDGVHFLDNAEAGIAALIALLVQYGEGKMKSLQAVCDISSSPQNWEMAIKRMCGSDAWEGMLARMGGNLMHLKERELASSMSTMARFLRFLSTPAVAESTRSSTFDPAELRNKKTTVYLMLPPERAASLSQLLRLWIGTLLRGVVKGGLQEKTKIHFVIDEANIVGKMDQISDALTIGRGFGLKIQLYYQDCGQLKKCWPDGADQTLLANCAQVFFAVNDQLTAEYVSSRLGEETIIVSSGGTGTSTSYQRSENGQTSVNYSRSTNDNWAQQAHKLLKPEQVTGLSERIGICLTPGVPPIWTTLVRYYEPGFKKTAKRVWPAIGQFFQSLVLLLVLGGFAYALTVVAQQTLSGTNDSAPVLLPPNQ